MNSNEHESVLEKDKVKRENIEGKENNLLSTLVPNIAGTGSNLAVGIQLQNYIENTSDDYSDKNS